MPEDGARDPQLPFSLAPLSVEASPPVREVQSVEALPPDPPLFVRAPLSAAQQKSVSSFVQFFFSLEKSLGDFTAGSVDTCEFENLLGGI